MGSKKFCKFGFYHLKVGSLMSSSAMSQGEMTSVDKNPISRPALREAFPKPGSGKCDVKVICTGFEDGAPDRSQFRAGCRIRWKMTGLRFLGYVNV